MKNSKTYLGKFQKIRKVHIVFEQALHRFFKLIDSFKPTYVPYTMLVI